MVHRSRSLRALAVPLVAITVSATSAFAADPPLNIELVSNFIETGQLYADVWGEGDFAFLAHKGQPRVDIIDISDPENPVKAATYNTGVGSAQDVKTGNGLMFVGLESAAPGVHIVDVRDPNNPVKLTNVTVADAVHNVFYHEGWLYICSSAVPGLFIVDLRNYDPDNAPATISQATWIINGPGNFVHDMTVQGDYLFASGYNALYLYDITNIATQKPTFLTKADGSSVHSAWATDDLRFVVIAEERTGAGVYLFEIVQTEATGAVSLVLRDSYAVPTSRATSAHNPVIIGYTVYVAWNQIGTQIFEIDPVLKRLGLTASYDTTEANGNTGFEGNWGIYPFLGDDRILASDRQTGLWVLDAELTSAPTISVTGSCPGQVTVDVSGGTPNAEVAIVSAGAQSGFLKKGLLCNGSLLDIGEPFALPPTFVPVDGSGNGSSQMTLQSGRCFVQGLDFGNCRASNLVDAD